MQQNQVLRFKIRPTRHHRRNYSVETSEANDVPKRAHISLQILEKLIKDYISLIHLETTRKFAEEDIS
jgi:hypothetical protein